MKNILIVSENFTKGGLETQIYTMYQESLRNKKAKFIFALGNLGSKIIVFFLVPFYTHYLTTEEYAIGDSVFTASQLLIPFFSIVIFDAVIRYALYYKENPQIEK